MPELQREAQALGRDPGRTPLGQHGVPFREEETVQHQQGQAQGNQDHRRGGQDPARHTTAHRKECRGEGHGDRQRPAALPPS